MTRIPLQWGRGQLATVMAQQVVLAGINTLKLQWGRGQLATVIEEHQVPRRLDPVASMGPRPVGHGDTNSRLVPESCWKSGFNGAAASWPR